MTIVVLHRWKKSFEIFDSERFLKSGFSYVLGGSALIPGNTDVFGLNGLGGASDFGGGFEMSTVICNKGK